MLYFLPGSRESTVESTVEGVQNMQKGTVQQTGLCAVFATEFNTVCTVLY